MIQSKVTHLQFVLCPSIQKTDHEKSLPNLLEKTSSVEWSLRTTHRLRSAVWRVRILEQWSSLSPILEKWALATTLSTKTISTTSFTAKVLRTCTKCQLNQTLSLLFNLRTRRLSFSRSTPRDHQSTSRSWRTKHPTLWGSAFQIYYLRVGQGLTDHPITR